MSNSVYASRRGNLQYNVNFGSGEKSCRRVDYRDHMGRLVRRVWSYESDGQIDQLTYSAVDGVESGVICAPQSFMDLTTTFQN